MGVHHHMTLQYVCPLQLTRIIKKRGRRYLHIAAGSEQGVGETERRWYRVRKVLTEGNRCSVHNYEALWKWLSSTDHDQPLSG